MHFLTPPFGGPEKPFETWVDGWSTQELDLLESLAAASRDAAVVGVGNGQEDVPETRRSNVSWLTAEADNAWIFQRLAHQALTVNRQHWSLDITGFGEALQLTRYEGGDEGHYDWHQDFGGQVSRKLSIVVQLTDPDAYEGGELQIMASAKPLVIPKKRGLVTIFPSYQLHRVTPVTKGDRHTLVAWLSGPRFR